MVCKNQDILEENGETGAGCHKDNGNSNRLLLQPKTTIFFFNLSCQQLRHTVKELHTLVKRARFILQRRSFGDKV